MILITKLPEQLSLKINQTKAIMKTLLTVLIVLFCEATLAEPQYPLTQSELDKLYQMDQPFVVNGKPKSQDVFKRDQTNMLDSRHDCKMKNKDILLERESAFRALQRQGQDKKIIKSMVRGQYPYKDCM